VPKTYAQQLDEVQAAISAIEGGAQDYTIGTRRVLKGDLATLYEREKWLRAMTDREARGGGVRQRQIIPLDD